MRVPALVAVLLLASSCSSAPPPTGGSPPAADAVRTLRLDYFHTGSSTQELFSLDELVVEPAPWPGQIARTEDVMRYGAYGFDVRDAATSKLIFSGGFGSIFDEWATTEEATKVTRTFHESVRFPMPAAPVTVTIRKRGPKDSWRDGGIL